MNHPSPVLVRLQCMDIATRFCCREASLESMIDIAKAIAKEAWGGMEPIPRQLNHLTTIEDAANATRDRLEEVIKGMPEGSEKLALREARATWERFIAQLEQAIGERFS